VAATEPTALERLRRDFAAGMSHDLRTPLAQIQLFTEMLLLHRDRSEAERTDWLQVIEREAHALGGMIDNLLLLAHGSDPAAFPAREPLDLGLLLEDVAAAFARRAASCGVEIVADPPCGVVVEADPRCLRQMLANLVDNALRFGPAGQRIVLSLRTDAGRAEVTVEDKGPGLSPEDRARLLEPPRCGDPLRVRADGGRGLGLSVVAQVVHAHGGKAAVEEAPGGGARVRITLPCATLEPPRAPAI
jgi:two-component system phosphate regulon sensor histidine kinase PhoR